MILQEVVTLLQSLPPGAAGIEQVEAVVTRWRQRWPSVQQPTADACLTVIHVRGLLLDALMQEWPRDQQHQGQTVYQVCAHQFHFIYILVMIGLLYKATPMVASIDYKCC